MKADRCTLVKLPMQDFDRSIEDPKLAALLRDGWTPIGHIAISEEGTATMAIMLAPPKSQPDAVDVPKPAPDPTPTPSDNARSFVALVTVLWCASLAVAGLIGWAL